MRGRVGLSLMGVLGLGVLAGTPAMAQSTGVSVVDDAFQPREVEVDAGSALTWTNEGGTQHTVTADNGSFESGNLDPGDDFTETFADPGRYPYYCEYHGDKGGVGMAGVLVVTGGSGGGSGGGAPEDPTEEVAPETSVVPGEETDLPQTGTAVDAFLYLALALIASGTVLVRLGSPVTARSRR